MTNKQFEKLIESIPTIEVSLEWSHLDGGGSFEEEFESKPFLVLTNFGCFESGIFDPGDYHTEPSFSSKGLYVYDIETNVYDTEGEEIKLSSEQIAILSKGIESSIISN